MNEHKRLESKLQLLRMRVPEWNPADTVEALLLFRLCLDKAAIGIYHTDENGTIFSANDFACSNLGY
jgi:hypothetical protein